MKIKECKENIINCILKIVSAECFSMCSTKNPSLYRQVNADSLATLNFVDLKNELNERAPLLVNILSAMTKTTEEVPLVTSAAVILKWRNIHMSRIHHVVGQLLDQGGATDETIQLVSTLGFSVGSSAVYKKQEDLVSRQEDKRNTEICGQVEQKILQFKCDKTKEMIFVLKGTDVTNSQSYYREMQTEFATGNKSYFETNFCAKSYSPYSMCAATEPPMSDSKRQQLTANVFIPALTISGGRKESILFPEVKINSGLELEPFRSTTMSNSSKTLLNGKSFIDRHKENLSNDNLQPPFEIIGDNIDLMKSPSAMTRDKQRQSLHWFLLIGLQKRVISDLPDIEPKNDISILPNSTFLPSKEETTLFENHMIFHISKVLTKHIECLQPYASSVPKYISHPFIEESSKPSTYHILDLLDKSENKSDEMISILETVHEKYIAHSDDDPACVIEKKVFGGDVLTNERAYSAMLAMMNGPSDFCRLGGVIHRPEGLHRMMNFLLFIYQEFYKTTSAAQQGTLFQLRNVIHRVDVSGPDRVVDSFRAHFSFVEDCLDAYIVGAAMNILGLDSLAGTPTRHQLHFLHFQTTEEKCAVIKELAKEIVQKHIHLDVDLEEKTAEAQELDDKMAQINAMFDSESKVYECTYSSKTT